MSQASDEASARELVRLRWQCRRGMLELDLLLDRFLSDGWMALDGPGRRTFERLLAFPDPILHDWLMEQAVPADPELAQLVARVRAATAGVRENISVA